MTSPAEIRDSTAVNTWITATNTKPETFGYTDAQATANGTRGNSGPKAIIGAESSGCYDTLRHEFHFFGGGHGDYHGNEMMTLHCNVNPITISRRYDQFPNPVLEIEQQSDGSPSSRHSHGGITYISHADKVMMHGGSLSGFSGFRTSEATWTWNPAVPTRASWVLRNANSEGALDVPSVYAPDLKQVFWGSESSNGTGGKGLWRYTYDTNTWTKVSSTHEHDNRSFVYDIKRGRVWCATANINSTQGQVFFYNVRAGSYIGTKLTLSGAAAAELNATYFYPVGFSYDPILDRLLYLNPQNDKIYSINPDTGVVTGLAFLPAGINSTPNGIWSRMFYSPTLNAHGFISLWTDDVVFFKASSGAGSTGVGINVPLYGIHEQSFTDSGSYSNPYTQVTTAACTFTKPGGGQVTIPLFWDGGNTWKVRFSPYIVGAWTGLVSSSDAGLDGATANFTCIASNNNGGIRTMADFPYHFEYQNGTPYFWHGDTQWRLPLNMSSEGFNRTTLFAYLDKRASQGFNSITFNILHNVGDSNEGGVAFTSLAAETINPAFFQELDIRVAYANTKGITLGVMLNWADDFANSYDWSTFPSQAARLRYASYVTARYSAYNVYFIVAGEWNEWTGNVANLNAIGNEIMNNDPHARLRGIHGNSDATTEATFSGETWMSFGSYDQEYESYATGITNVDLHAQAAQARDHSKPVVNDEYGYFRDPVGYPSDTVARIRREHWSIIMAGAYATTGWIATYSGGDGYSGPFELNNPLDAPWETQSKLVKDFFAATQWWNLVPSDSLITGSGTKKYCLAEPNTAYVVYNLGSSTFTINLAAATGTFAVKRFDPRTGTITALADVTAGGSRSITLPDSQDWVVHLQKTGQTTMALVDRGAWAPPAFPNDPQSVTSKVAWSDFKYCTLLQRILFWMGGGHTGNTSDNSCLQYNPSSPSSGFTHLVTPTAYLSQASGLNTTTGAFSDNKACSRHNYGGTVWIPETSELLNLTGDEGQSIGAAGGTIPKHYVHHLKVTSPFTQVHTVPYITALNCRFGAVARDPVSGMVLRVDGNTSVGGRMHWYNPVTRQFITSMIAIAGTGYFGALVYFPPTGKFYLMSRQGKAGIVYEITPNRSNFAASTLTTFMSGAPYTGQQQGFAYDSRNEVIGGGASGSTFWTFDPRRSTPFQAVNMGGSIIGGGAITYGCIDYSPDHNAFIFLGGSSATGRRIYELSLGSGATPSLVISPSSQTVVSAGQIQFTTSGGSGTKSWNTSAGFGTVTQTGLWTAPTVTQSTTGTVTVSDSTGSSTANITVNAAAATLAISPLTPSVAVSQTIDFNASGGVTPYIFSRAAVSGGLGSINSGSGLFTAASTAGQNDVTVTDSAAPTPATATTRVTINAAAGGGVLVPYYVGTLQDETDTYTLLGWPRDTDIEDFNNLTAHTSSPKGSTQSVHQGPESDQLWVLELMYQRCVATLGSSHAASLNMLSRLNDWLNYYLNGTFRNSSEFTSVDESFRFDHPQGRGLVLHYRRTGNAAALTEARAILGVYDAWWKSGSAGPGGTAGVWPTQYSFALDRAIGSQLLHACLVYESSANAADGVIRDNLITLYKTSPHWDEARGTYFANQSVTDAVLTGTAAPSVPAGASYASGYRVISSVNFGWIAAGIIEAVRVTNDTELKRRLIKMADFIMTYGSRPASSDANGQFLSVSAYGVTPGGAYFDNWWNQGDVKYTIIPINLLVWAYMLTGNQSYLTRARRHYIYENQNVSGSGVVSISSPPSVQRYMDMQFKTDGTQQPIFSGYSPFCHYLFQGGGQVPVIGSAPPSVVTATITLTNGPNFTQGIAVDPTFSLTASGGTVTTGQLFRDGVPIAGVDVAPAQPWTKSDVDPPAGTFSYTFGGTDSNGNQFESSPVEVFIAAAPTVSVAGPSQISAGGNVVLAITTTGYITEIAVKESGNHLPGSPLTTAPFNSRQFTITAPSTATHTIDVIVTGHPAITAIDQHVFSVIATNTVPTIVSFVADNLNVRVGDTVNFTWSITDPDAGQTNRVEAVHNGQVIAQDGPRNSGTAVQFIASWMPQTAGSYPITPKAFDDFSPQGIAIGTLITVVVSPQTSIPPTIIQHPFSGTIPVKAGDRIPLQASGANIRWAIIRNPPKPAKFQEGSGPNIEMVIPLDAKRNEVIEAWCLGDDGQLQVLTFVVRAGDVIKGLLPT